MTDHDDSLAHYGVKGMKWGVRRTKKQLARARSKRGANASEDVKRHRANKKKGTAALSDKELKQMVERMNTEAQYARLNPTRAQRGHSAVKTILGVGATATTAYNFSKSPVGKAIADGITQSITNDVGRQTAKAVQSIGRSEISTYRLRDLQRPDRR